MGYKPKEIQKHGSVFAPEEEDDGASRQRREGVKAYTKTEVAKTLEDALVNVLQPIVGGDVILKGKKKDALISELFSRMNGAKPSERAKIARKLAEEVLAMTDEAVALKTGVLPFGKTPVFIIFSFLHPILTGRLLPLFLFVRQVGRALAKADGG